MEMPGITVSPEKRSYSFGTEGVVAFKTELVGPPSQMLWLKAS
jgi:hypothetical protein